MRLLFTLSLVPVLTCASYAQTQEWGQVYFDNSVAFQTLADRLVRTFDGSLVVGTYHVAQLYYGTNFPSNLLPLTNPPATFRPPGTSSPGTWVGGMRTLVGIPPGTQTYMEVRFWHTDAGATFEEASRNNGPYRWFSGVFTYVPPPPGSPVQAHYIENFRGVSSDCGAPIAATPEILVQPTNQVVQAGQDVVISVVSTNYCGHLWQFNGTNITATNLPGSRFLVLTNVQPSQAGDYRVIVGVPPFLFGRFATSQVARLTVEAPPQWGEVNFANNVAFTTTANRLVYWGYSGPIVGSPLNQPPAFVAQLYYGTNAANLVPVTNAPARFRPGTTGPGIWLGGMRTLTGFLPGQTVVCEVRVWDASWSGTFEEAPCRGQSGTFFYTPPPHGSPSAAYFMESLRGFGAYTGVLPGPATILQQPTNQVASVGQTVIFWMTASNTFGSHWRHNGTNLGQRCGSLRINNVQLHHAGDYQAIVSGMNSTATSQVARLTVEAPPQWGEVNFANNVAFTTTADRLVRFLDGTPIVGSDLSQPPTFVAQLYYGTNPSDLVPVTNAPARFRPGTTGPGLWLGGIRTLTGFLPGQPVVLQVRFWYANCSATWEEARTNGSFCGAQSSTFSYTPPPHGSPSHAYYIEGFRGFGGVGAPTPAVLQQPTNQIAYVGQTVILSVISTNACGFQWQFNGIDLPSGKCEDLRIDNVQLSHEGDYRVIVTGAGLVTSQVARLTVRRPPQFASARYDGGAFAFQVLEDTGRAVVIETAPDLNAATSWTPVFTNIAPFSFTNSTPADRQRFYRTVIR